MIEVENTDGNKVRNFIPMRNHIPASAYGLKAISDWFFYFPHLRRRFYSVCGWLIFYIAHKVKIRNFSFDYLFQNEGAHFDRRLEGNCVRR